VIKVFVRHVDFKIQEAELLGEFAPDELEMVCKLFQQYSTFFGEDEVRFAFAQFIISDNGTYFEVVVDDVDVDDVE